MRKTFRWEGENRPISIEDVPYYPAPATTTPSSSQRGAPPSLPGRVAVAAGRPARSPRRSTGRDGPPFSRRRYHMGDEHDCAPRTLQAHQRGVCPRVQFSAGGVLVGEPRTTPREDPRGSGFFVHPWSLSHSTSYGTLLGTLLGTIVPTY